MKFKKIAAVLAGAVMLTSTVALAAAANYSAPFVSGGSADVAIVYGSNAANTDLVAALEINSDLTSKLAAQTATGTTAGSSTTSGGDSYKLEKSSTKFHLGDSAGNVVSTSITDSNLPALLADGVYTDDDNDEFDYTQTVTLGNNINVTMFEDNDYKSKVPTVGIKIPNGGHVLNYTLDFTDQPEWADLSTTNLPILGKSYYVLSNSSTVGESLTLLDSANTVEIAEGETKTVTVGEKSYEISINYIGSTSVKLNVNGETTNTLDVGETQKLSDKSYVGVKDILYVSKDTGISKVEISIGKGKLLLTDGSDVELNDESISGLSVDIVNSSTKLDKITLAWDAEDDSFVTEDQNILMPGFEVIQLSFGGLNYPAQEKTVVENDGDDSIVLSDFALKDSTENINILYSDGTSYTLVGKDSDSLLVTSEGNLTFDGDTDNWFVASWNDSQDSESYLLRATDWKNESSTQKVTIQQRKNGAWVDLKVDAQSGDTITVGNVEIGISDPVKVNKNVSITANNSGTKFDRIYSNEGLRVMLPIVNTTSYYNFFNGTNYADNTAACSLVTFTSNHLIDALTVQYNKTSGGQTNASCVQTSYTLNLKEEDKDGTLAAGNAIAVALGMTSDGNVKISSVDMGTSESGFSEQGDTEVFRGFAYSELATEAIWDESGDQDSPLTLTYHGTEVTADVYVAAPGVTVTPGTAGTGTGVTSLGSVAVADSEVSTVSGKNLIVVGGSCVNSVAAKLLGTGAGCGDSFTTASGIKAGEALIKTFASPYSASKVATLVAGYNAGDTTNAAKYLTTQTVDTTVGKGVKVTSATQAVALTSTA